MNTKRTHNYFKYGKEDFIKESVGLFSSRWKSLKLEMLGVKFLFKEEFLLKIEWLNNGTDHLKGRYAHEEKIL